VADGADSCHVGSYGRSKTIVPKKAKEGERKMASPSPISRQTMLPAVLSTILACILAAVCAMILTDGEMLAVIVATAGALLAGGILLLRMCQTSDC
jgi:hypothetical protein